MTLNEVAAAAGVSKMAVSKKKLPHVKNKDGSFFYDPETPEVKSYINRVTRNRSVARREQKKKQEKPKIPAEKKQIEMGSGGKKPRHRDLEVDYGQDEDEDYRNLILKNRKLELDIGEKRKDLIPHKLVERWIKHLFDADTTALKVIPDRIGSNLAMLARGADDEAMAGNLVRNLLAEEIARIIVGIKRVQKDFKKSIEPGLFDKVETIENSEQEAV